MVSKIMDIHNHTICSDGYHTSEEIIQNAIKNGVVTIGISDHYNTQKCNSIEPQGLIDYIKNIEEQKKRYSDRIEILCGVEICANKQWSDLDRLPYDKLNKLDYVLLEYIDLFSDSLKLNEIEDLRNNLSCRVGLAHTDIFSLSSKYGLNNIIKILKNNDIFWEINVNEGYCYFDYIIDNLDKAEVRNTFQSLKDNNIEITVGSDTHSLFYYDINRIKLGNALSCYQLDV